MMEIQIYRLPKQSLTPRATKPCTYLTQGHMFSNDKDKVTIRIHKAVFSLNLVCLQLFCDTKCQESKKAYPTQPCQRLRGCCLLSGSMVLLKDRASLQELTKSGVQSSLGLLSSASAAPCPSDSPECLVAPYMCLLRQQRSHLQLTTSWAPAQLEPSQPSQLHLHPTQQLPSEAVHRRPLMP
ncbi:TPA: hypothetical protein ACH3X1_014277 [Trebouxia sp. C0004]